MPPRKPALYQLHSAAGADFTDFGGWEMPVEFDGIREEHTAVRERAGVFDVSHMSEVSVSGPDATALMNRLTTNDVGELDAGDAQYACVLDERGVILDDTVVYCYPDRDGYLFVPNAGHGEQMTDRWRTYAADLGLTVDVENRTDEFGLLALQGPSAVETVDAVATDDLAGVGRFESVRTDVAGVSCLVARTGYTGEDGFEIFFDAADAERLWSAFEGVQPCGLGARDTLRLEAGLLLSGQDFHPEEEPRTPLEAGLEFVVDFSTRFVGRSPLCEQREAGVDERVVGLRVEGRGIARHGYTVCHDGEAVGHVTSGTMSPTFNMPLAIGYVKTPFTDPGTNVDVQVRDRAVDATVVDKRFLESLERGQREAQ